MVSCRMPIVSLVAWEDRAANFIFVRIPTEYGRYLRTDRCVAHVPCPYKTCGATVGEPCMHNGKYVGGTHAVRRDEYNGNTRRKTHLIPEKKDVIDGNDGARVTIK